MAPPHIRTNIIDLKQISHHVLSNGSEIRNVVYQTVIRVLFILFIFSKDFLSDSDRKSHGHQEIGSPSSHSRVSSRICRHTDGFAVLSVTVTCWLRAEVRGHC